MVHLRRPMDAATRRPGSLRTLAAWALPFFVMLPAGLLGACAEDSTATAIGGGGYTDPDSSTKKDTAPDVTTGDGSVLPDAPADVVDGGGGGSGGSDAGACIPKTCAQVGAECGNAPDGCGGKLACGTCDGGKQCGGGGQNKCGTNACFTKTCVQVGASCGYATDGCADVIDCGKCLAPTSCGGAGKPNECGCTAKTCSQLGASCGSVPDGCTGKVECGVCPSGEACGGGGVANQCGKGTCSPKSCSQLSASCGYVSDGCGTALDCGKCAAPNVCGGAGILNQCGCSPKTCSQLGASCGPMPNGCGQTIDCGACPGGEVCGGSGVPHQCGCKCSLPHAVTSCTNAVCTLVQCEDGWADCDGVQTNGCETQTSADVSNCGVCGQQCSFTNASASCNAGKCEMGACTGGFSDCNASPVDGCEQPEDVQHCGSCTNDCTAASPANVTASACSGGVCAVGACATGYFDQNGTWSDGCECLADNAAATCNAAPTVTVAVGASVSADGTLVPNGQPDWYAVKFNGNNTCAYHPRVTLEDKSGTGLLRIDVATNCSSAFIACGGGGNSSGKTKWEFTWEAGKTCGAQQQLDPTKVPASPSTVYVRVYATGPSTGCLPYTITAAN